MTKLPPPTSKRLAALLEANAIERAGGIENYRRREKEGYAPMLKRLKKQPQAPSAKGR